MPDDEKRPRIFAVAIENSTDIKIGRINVGNGNVGALHAINSKNIGVGRITGPDGINLALIRDCEDVLIRSIKQIPSTLREELKNTIKRNDKDGFLGVVKRIGGYLPPERIESLLNMADRFL